MKTQTSVVEYHLRELATARDPASPDYVMPHIPVEAGAVLDIGCGIGQTLAASGARNRVLVGLDTDLDSLAYGRRTFSHIWFVNGTAERLPFADSTFDLIVCRVSLPYTDLRRSLSEVHRVLAPGGRVWFTLHSLPHVLGALRASCRALRFRDVALRLYVIANGLAFHFVGWQFALRVPPFVPRRIESFQTVGGMTGAMHRHGFDDVWVGTQGRHLVCTAAKSTRLA